MILKLEVNTSIHEQLILFKRKLFDGYEFLEAWGLKILSAGKFADVQLLQGVSVIHLLVILQL